MKLELEHTSSYDWHVSNSGKFSNLNKRPFIFWHGFNTVLTKIFTIIFLEIRNSKAYCIFFIIIKIKNTSYIIKNFYIIYTLLRFILFS